MAQRKRKIVRIGQSYFNAFTDVAANYYQDKRLTLYLPGNGSLLAAIALMCAGPDGTKIKTPGFPNDGQWRVRGEGLKPLP